MAEKENPSRPWREIAKEVSEAQSTERFWELTIELDKALEAEEKRLQLRGDPSQGSKGAVTTS